MKKKSVLDGKTYNPELISNVLLRNDNVRTKILEKFYDQSNIDIFNQSISNVKKQ